MIKIPGDVKQFSNDKILRHIDRVHLWLEKGISFPITYELDMTNICNNKCPHCIGWLDGPRTQDFIPLEAAKNIIDQIADFHGRAVTFTGGGEPLCNPATIPTLEYVKSKGMDTAFITNGLTMTEEDMKVILKNSTWCRVSLDADSPETYKYTHGLEAEAFNKVVANLKRLVELKKELNSKCTVGVGFLTNEQTIKAMIPFTQLCKDIGADYAQFRPYHYDKTDISKELTECQKLISPEFNVLHSKHKYDHMFDPKRTYEICHGHHFATVISADQKMYLCCHMRGIQKYCLGDLKERSLKEIWNSDHRKQLCENIDFKDCPPLCRCDTFNTILFNLKKPREHVNFL